MYIRSLIRPLDVDIARMIVYDLQHSETCKAILQVSVFKYLFSPARDVSMEVISPTAILDRLEGRVMEFCGVVRREESWEDDWCPRTGFTGL